MTLDSKLCWKKYQQFV